MRGRCYKLLREFPKKYKFKGVAYKSPQRCSICSPLLGITLWIQHFALGSLASWDCGLNIQAATWESNSMLSSFASVQSLTLNYCCPVILILARDSQRSLGRVLLMCARYKLLCAHEPQWNQWSYCSMQRTCGKTKYLCKKEIVRVPRKSWQHNPLGCACKINIWVSIILQSKFVWEAIYEATYFLQIA